MMLTFAISFGVFLLSVIVCCRLVRIWQGGVVKSFAVFVFCTISLCSCALISYIGFYLIWPASDLDGIEIADGIQVRRLVQIEPQRWVLTIARVDLAVFSVAATPPDFYDPQLRYRAMTTSRALRVYEAVLAVNASFFRPFRDKNLFDYYPHSGDLVEVIGQTEFAGRQFGVLQSGWPTVMLAPDGIKIAELNDPPNFEGHARPNMVVSGKSLLVSKGINVAVSDGKRYPRTAIGIDQDGRYFWMIVADGKQLLYSGGIDLHDLAKIMAQLGIYDGVELDGGGSSTMAAVINGRAQVISRPSHTNLPARERPVANHLIIRPKLKNDD